MTTVREGTPEELAALLDRLDNSTEIVTSKGVWRADGSGTLTEKPPNRLREMVEGV